MQILITMQKFTLGIEMELHISPKNSAIKKLREGDYDDSRSTPKADEQRKKNLRSVHALIKDDLGEFVPLAATEKGLSGDKDYTGWAVEEDSSIITTKKDICNFKIFANECPIFLISIISYIFVFKLHYLKIRELTYAGRWC